MGIFTNSLPSSGGSSSRGGLFSTPETRQHEADRYEQKLATNKKAFAQGLKRLVESGARGDAWKIYEQNRGVFSPEELKEYGLDGWVRDAEREDWIGATARKNKDGNVLGKVFSVGDTITGGALSTALEFLDKPSQYSKLVIGELASGDFKGAGSAVAASLNPINYFNNDIKSRIRASGLDQNEDGRLENMREALGKDPQGGGRLLGAFDFTAEILTDPTTYISFGAGSLGKAGLRKVAATYGDDVMRQIQQRGLRKALKQGIRDAAGREITEDMLRATFREAAQEEVKSEAARRAARKLRDKYGQETAAEMLAQRQMRAIARSGRSGVRLWNPATRSYHTIAPLYPGGRSLPGFAKYPWQVGREAADILEDVPPSGRTLNPDGSIVGVAEPVRESLENVDLARVPDAENPRIMRGDDIPEFGRVREVRPDGTAVIDLNPGLLSPTENISDVIRAPQRTAAEGLPFADETFDQRLANRVTPEEAIRRVEAAPSSTGAGGYGPIVDAQLPRTPGVVHSPEDGLLGIRAADGTLEGYVMYTDDAIGTFENLSGRRGVGQELLDALEAQGVDVPALLANSDFTKAGRGSALKWLKGKAAAAPAAEVVDAFPPGSTLTAEGTETTFTVLGKTEDGRLVVQVDDPEALIPFKRTPVIRGNKTVQVNPNAVGPPDTPHKGRFVYRGQANVAGIQRLDTIPGVGVVTAVDDEGRMIVRRPDVTRVDDAARPSRLLTRGGDMPQRPVQEGLEFADETADQLAARSPGRQAAVEVGEEVPGVGRVTSVEGRRVVVQLDDRFFGSKGPDAFRFRQSRPIREELFPEEPLRKASLDIPTTPDVPLRGGGASAPVRRSLGGVLRESRPGRVLREAFVPRTKVADRFGRSVAQTLYENVEQAAARMSRNVNDLILQIGKVSDRAAKELSKGPGPALRELMPELADRKGYDAFNDLALGEFEGRINSVAVREALRSDGMENVVKALDAFADVAGRGADELSFARGGVEAAEELFESAPPAPRILTEEGAKALRGNLALKELLGIDTTKLRAGEDLSRFLDPARPEVERLAADGGPWTRVEKAALPGTSYARMPVREVNDELVRRLNLPEGTKLFEDDARAQVALRSRTAFEAAAQTELYERLAKETFDGENPMLMIVRSSDSPVAREKAERRAKDLGYKKVESNTGKQPMIGDVYGPPELVDEIAKVQDLIVNDESLRRLSDFLTKWSGVWASQATVPLIFGTGFHSRNAIGNVINAFNGGLQNPARFVEAGRVQRAVGRARARMKKDGISWEKALEREVKSPRIRRLINDMRNHGIMSEGFFADLTADELDSLLKRKSIKDWVNPKNWPERLGDNALISSGRKVGQVVEDNARVALYLDHYAKTGSVQQAANQVKKYLFDYSDLTPFEKRTMRAINRFYTFTRKNLAIQLYTLAMDPWRIKLAASAEQKFFDREGTDNAAMPEYARKEGFNITNILGRGVAVDVDTPLDAAIEALDPIAQAISITPGLQHFVPPEYRSSGRELASSLFNFRAGGPTEMANFIVEQVTGVDTFTGADISDERGRKTWDRFLKAISPLYAKGRTTTDIVRGKKEGMDLRLSLLQSLVGLSVLPLNDRTTNQVAYVGAQEVQNVIADLRAQGIDVPTYSELVAVGLAPDLSSDEEKGERRSPEEAAQARVDKVNAARRALGAPVFRPQPQSQPQQQRRRRGVFLG